MNDSSRTILWVTIFSIAFAYVESSVVVYLRAIYYPEGFVFPLKMVSWEHLTVELSREAATMVMLAGVGILAGKSPWLKFGYFMISFGVWDVFYYVWLKAVLDWPSSVLEWDVLFLIPLPWISPVIAPVLISLLMITCGVLLVTRLARGQHFRPTFLSWVFGAAATIIILYSFISDTAATLGDAMPAPYAYPLLLAALLLYAAGFVLACRPPVKRA